MAEIGSAAVAVFPSFKGFRSKVEGEVESSGKEGGKKFGAAFKGAIGILAGAFAADKIISGFTSAVKAAGDLEQSAGAIQAVFKGSASDMLKWSAEASNAVGLTQNEFNELGTVIGAQLKNGGTAMDELAPKTNQLIGLGADLSSMFGGTSREAVEALSSALKGERDPIERYGVSLNQAKIDAEAAALGFSKVGGSFEQNAQQAATLSLIMKQTTDAQGNFAKEGETLAGQQQRMAAGWKDISAGIGGIFLPALTTAFGFINSSVLPVVDSLVSRLGDSGLGGVFAPIAAVAGPVLSTLAAQFAPLIPQVIGLVSAFSPLSLLFQVITPLLPQISSMFTVLTGVISAVLAQVLPLVTTLAAQLIPVFVQLVGGVLPPVISILGEVIGAIAPLISQIAGALIPIIQALMPVVVTVFGVIANVIRSAMQIIQGIIQVVTGVITGNWTQVWNGLVNIVQGTLRTVGSVLGGLRDIVASAIGNVGGWLVNSGRALIQGFIDGIKGMVGAIGSAIGGVLDFAKSFFPHSPAKRGPFSGRGYTSYSGQALAKDFAGGIDSQQNLVAKSANRLMSSAALSINPVAAGAVGGAGALAAAAAPIYVQNPFTGSYLLARVGSVASGVVSAADSQSQYSRKGRV